MDERPVAGKHRALLIVRHNRICQTQNLYKYRLHNCYNIYNCLSIIFYGYHFCQYVTPKTVPTSVR
jgi:hypothetical protein